MACGHENLTVGVFMLHTGVTTCGALPDGLSFPSIFGADVIAGTPTTPGYTIGEINGDAYYWTVNDGVLISFLPDPLRLFFTVGTFGSQTITPVGGPGGGSFSSYNSEYPLCPALAEDLPSGLSFGADGVISGTPAPGTVGSYFYQFVYKDSEFHNPTTPVEIVVQTGGGPGETLNIERQAADFIFFQDAVALALHEFFFGFSAADSLNLTDSAAIQITAIEGPPEEPPEVPAECIFEFYEIMAPENVETLPVPKTFDQVGPLRFDKIGKIFAFRLRMIMNGTTTLMPYKIYGDDSRTAKPIYDNPLYQGMFTTYPGMDYIYEIKLPKSVNSNLVRLVFGPTGDSWHRYDVMERSV